MLLSELDILEEVKGNKIINIFFMWIYNPPNHFIKKERQIDFLVSIEQFYFFKIKKIFIHWIDYILSYMMIISSFNYLGTDKNAV